MHNFFRYKGSHLKKKMTAEGKLANYSPKAKHTGLFI
jgi:hypothetical protein